MESSKDKIQQRCPQLYIIYPYRITYLSVYLLVAILIPVLFYILIYVPARDSNNAFIEAAGNIKSMWYANGSVFVTIDFIYNHKTVDITDFKCKQGCYVGSVIDFYYDPVTGETKDCIPDQTNLHVTVVIIELMLLIIFEFLTISV